jgi:hypothetical protein
MYGVILTEQYVFVNIVVGILSGDKNHIVMAIFGRGVLRFVFAD